MAILPPFLNNTTASWYKLVYKTITISEMTMNSLTITEIQANIRAFTEAYTIPAAALAIGAGGAMVAYGYRNTTADIDIGVEEDVFWELASAASERIVGRINGVGSCPPTFILSFPEYKIDIHCGRPPQKDLAAYKGLMLMTRQALYRQKVAMARPKDLADRALMRRKGFKPVLGSSKLP